MVFNEIRELNQDSLGSFRQEIKDIQQRRGEADSTLIEVDVDRLGEEEMSLWGKFKDCFGQVEKNLGNKEEMAKVQKQSVGPLVGEIQSIVRGGRMSQMKNEVAQFYAWLGNRMMGLMYPSEENLAEEKQQIFG